jgi:hypothetical protein
MIAVPQFTGRPGGSTGTSRLLTTGTACAALDHPTGA